jgi:hypothetical protein
MKKIIQHAFRLLLVICLLPSLASAQAWTRSKGKGFYKLDFARIYAHNIFDERGKVAPLRTLGNYTSSFYGEYGLFRKITLSANVPFYVRNVINETKGRQTGQVIEQGIVNNNFGDIDLALRFALPVKRFALSTTILFGLPTGDARQVDGLFTGDGEFNQLLKVSAGKGGTRWWIQGSLGLNNRTKGFSDEFRYDFEFGYKFFQDHLLAILKVNGIESLQNGSVASATTGLFSNNVEYMGIGPEVLYYLNAKKTFGVSARITGAIKGQNVLAAPSTSIGVFLDFK